LLRILSPRARLLIHKMTDDGEPAYSQLEQIKKKLWLAGYTDVHIGKADVENR
jgi:hypothetical protein